MRSKHLWMRTKQGMDYWKGPHSKIISATPEFAEYRQVHLAENSPGLWPAISPVETVIPAERRIDGIADVTFASLLSPLRGRKQVGGSNPSGRAIPHGGRVAYLRSRRLGRRRGGRCRRCGHLTEGAR